MTEVYQKTSPTVIVYQIIDYIHPPKIFILHINDCINTFVLGFPESFNLISSLVVVIVVSAWTIICILCDFNHTLSSSLDHSGCSLATGVKNHCGLNVKKIGEKILQT